MGYRIEVSTTRKGFVQVHFPGRIIALEATENAGPVWQVAIADNAGDRRGFVEVRADSPGDAVWRVAQATVRAVSALTGAPGEDGVNEDDPTNNLS
jgi:hypothetical protein